MLCVEEGPSKGAEYEVPAEGSVVVGRSPGCDLKLGDSQVSRLHFRIEPHGRKLRLTDLESQNGTYLNGEKLTEPVEVGVGDSIRAGTSVLRVLKGSKGHLTGRDLGGYRLEQRLGGGGMGEVYRATQKSLGRTVAVKILSDKLTSDGAFVDRFVAEARAAGRLSHPNVVQVYDVGNDEGRYFFSMEYLPGGSVQQLVDSEGELEVARSLEIVLQTARALEFAEKEGIVHCDVKPDNLLLTAEGDVRLSDLGIAKKVGEPGVGSSEGVFGSPHYMSPEQARGERLDHRSDLYSLGATLYRLVTGTTLFRGRSREIMEKQVFEEPKPPREVKRSISPGLNAVVMRLIKKDAGERYQSAGDLAKDLERVRDGAEKQARKSPPTRSTVRETRPRPRPSSAAEAKASGQAARPSRSRGGTARPTSKLMSILPVVAGVLVLAGVGFLLIRHLNRGAEAMRVAQEFDRAGRLREALAAYRRVAGIEGATGRGTLARDRIREIEDLIERRKQEELYLEEVRAAESRAAAGGEPLASAVEKLESMSRESTIALQVTAEPLKKLRARLEKEAAEELASRREEAEPLLAERRYMDAKRCFTGFPSWCRGTPAWDEAAAEAASVETRAREESGEALRQAEALLRELATRPEALDEARKLLFPFIHRTGMKDIADAARDLRDRVEARAREVQKAGEARAVKARSEEAESLARRSLLLEHGYHFAAARNLTRRAQNQLRRQGTIRRAAELDRRVPVVTRAEILFDKLLEKIATASLKAHAARLPGGPEGRIIGARKQAGQFVMRAESGDEVRFAWDRLPATEMLKLFRAMPLTPADRLTVAEFCLEHGLLAEAKRELIYTARVGPEHRELADSLLARARGSAGITSPDEGDAATLVEYALEEAGDGRADEAKKAHVLLTTRYAETDAARAGAAAIEQAIAAAQRGD